MNNTDKLNYKGIMIDEKLFELIKYMESVEYYRENLSNLSKSWDNLTIMGHLGNSNIDMESTKKSFSTLTDKLLNHLATETLKKTVREMTAKAQIAVDIVIRNLFERTADIGFLATDDDIRYFLQNTVSRFDPSYEENLKHMKKSFEEYVSKYSVYFDIVLMDQQGNVLVNLDDSLDLAKSNDEIIDLVLNTSEEYIETYKYHDFTPQYNKTLVYSYKVTKTNEDKDDVIGILSLCFRFTDEMKGIFGDLVNEQNQECITLLDKTGTVIASSDKYHVPLGAKLELVKNEIYKVISFGGRYYLAKTCSTNGYQDFMGLGWYGHIMVPLEYAFLQDQGEDISIDDNVLQAILQYGENFSQELKEIPLRAEEIQHNLNRAVWNGNIAQSKNQSADKNFSRVLLNEVSKTGENTKNIFNSSIINLTKTIILNDTVSIASLMIDIMDRNLYERANDCRWWALTSEFRSILDNKELNYEHVDKLSSILKYINNLYTVYTNLFIYDKNGVIIAVSNEDEKLVIGKKLDNLWVEKTLKINDSSKYCVSDFEKTDLYNNRHTYIYNSSIKSLKDENTIVGGIGIVFDSEVEFDAMINESLPRYVTGEIKKGVFGVLASKDKTVIASSSKDYKTGDVFALDDKYFELKNGESLSQIITLNGKYYALGVKCSSGYREYKSSKDDYENDLYSFFFSYISESDIKVDFNEDKTLNHMDTVLDDEDCEDCAEVATFFIGQKYLGVHASNVLEAVSVKELESSITLNDNHYFKGSVVHKQKVVSVIDIGQFIQEQHSSEYTDIIIVNFDKNNPEQCVGILIDDLSGIVDVKLDKIKPIENHLISGGALIESIVALEKDHFDNKLLTLLNIQKLKDELTE
ncbi:MAG: chemotaxis protein CheW [Campylobacterota bacterium]|nr:chemotaxis protein CheW [Campylobacterota bacterium]